MKTPRPTKNAERGAPTKRQFTGTDNPRHLRALAALLSHPVPREQIDAIAGCSNGPELIAELRRRGLGKDHLPCERITTIQNAVLSLQSAAHPERAAGGFAVVLESVIERGLECLS